MPALPFFISSIPIVIRNTLSSNADTTDYVSSSVSVFSP
ncbi:hypothetical protein QY95_03105 [Bacillus thermotolerans]|uniref:Uncharacterized protein n=1 Tax=Bacillus thermotolerans TaxID=1221996 RepID=A0A0F5HTI0_BACTR|nr:hypothetical protein QY95_03105 [Bacillus thermotolerans]